MYAGELFTRWTAIGSVLLFAASLCLRFRAQCCEHPEAGLVLARRVWTAGLALFLVHVWCAFQFVHGWSHQSAYAATARETFETTGWNSGAGLYSNYLFTLVWFADAMWWWRGVTRYEGRPRGINATILWFLGLMAFNATVVFGEGIARACGVAASIAIAIAWLWSLRSGRFSRRW